MSSKSNKQLVSIVAISVLAAAGCGASGPADGEPAEELAAADSDLAMASVEPLEPMRIPQRPGVEICAVSFYDDVNDIRSMFVYGSAGTGPFFVNIIDDGAWGTTMFPGAFDQAGNVDFFGLGVPPITVGGLVHPPYQDNSLELLHTGASSAGQVHYRLLDGDTCTPLGLGAIQFLIYEWVYYG